MREVRAWLFDAYGTLFDVQSVVEACRTLTDDAPALAALWRSKQLEYTWLRSLMGRYEDFWAVTEAALDFACRRLGLVPGAAERARVMEAYLTLDPFPEVRGVLTRLRGLPCAILSNGTPRMLEAAVTHAGLAGAFTALLSVDAVRIYKPAPQVYALGPAHLGVPREAIGFVSANAWDVAGAKAFGFRVVWVNRTGAPGETLGLAPDLEVADLEELARALGR